MKKQNYFLENMKSVLLVVALLFMGVQLNAQVAKWNFDAGVTASPTTYNGTVVGSPTYTAGKVGNALTLSGTGQYVTTPFVINPLNASFTATAWVKYTGTINNSLTVSPVIIQQADVNGTGRGWLWLSKYSATTANSLRFASSIGGSATYGTTVPVSGTWYMVSVTYSAGTVKIYVNGVLDGTSTKTAETSDGGLLIGSSKAFDNLWTGSIDEVAVYNTALSAAELLTIYNNASTSVNQLSSASNKIFASNKSIVVEDVTSEVTVFNVTGASIQSSKMVGTFTSKILNPGIYLVRVDGNVQKVVVK